jgi:murein DD-endopeptidase MepM/ murein hydrolase activator NlpD
MLHRPALFIAEAGVIGAAGNAGCASGPHVHVEIRLNTVTLDPLSGYLP